MHLNVVLSIFLIKHTFVNTCRHLACLFIFLNRLLECIEIRAVHVGPYIVGALKVLPALHLAHI